MHTVDRMRPFQNLPPKISFVNFIDFRDLKDFHENSTARNFWARDLIFWNLTHIIYAYRLVTKFWSLGPFWSFSGMRVLRPPSPPHYF